MTFASTGPPTEWAWTFGDGATSTEENPTHTFAGDGAFDVGLAVTNSAGTDTVTKTVTVAPASGCTVTCSATAPQTTDLGVPTTFQSTATPTSCAGEPTYAWDFGDGGTSDLQNPVHAYTAVGTVRWRMTASADGADCTAAGDITERMVVAGQWADVGAPLLELALSGKVKVAARVPESWVGRFTDLESFTFTYGSSSTAHTAEIYSMQPMVQEASRSFEIVGTAPNDGSMRPGMFASVRLTSPESRRSLWLPASAVATSDLPQVLMVEDGQIVYRKVQIGRRDNGAIEIVSGLNEGEQVIKNVAGLTRGLPVKVVG